jgi:uncharacterized membrane protein YdjX (TVP38/TMEM64 family)
MSPETSPKKKARVILAGALLAAGGLAVAFLLLRHGGWQHAWDESRRIFSVLLDTVARAGPLPYFGAMALLPAVGCPMAPFAIAAGPLFGARLGFAVIVALGIVAITINLTLTYWLSRRWLRPVLSRLLVRFGYALPRIEGGDVTDLIVLLRVTPGIPFFVQNYLLGLAEAPFGRYLAISCGIQWTLNVAFMLFGDALSQGRGKLALSAILLLAAIMSATHLVRKRLARKRVAA